MLFLNAIPTFAQTPESSSEPPPAWHIIELTNQVRAEQGLPPLRHNPFLEAAANNHNQAMIEGDFFAHENPNTNTTAKDRVSAAGYNLDASFVQFAAVGENLAFGQTSPQQVIDEWMNSPDHRDNILNDQFREIGVAYAQTPDGTPYWTQVFGAQGINYPIVIESEAWQTQSPQISIYIYRADDAQQLRYAINQGQFSPFQPIPNTNTLTLQIPAQEQSREVVEVVVELANANGESIFAARDEIFLSISSQAQAQTQATATITPTQPQPTTETDTPSTPTPTPTHIAPPSQANQTTLPPPEKITLPPPNTLDQILTLPWHIILPNIFLLLLPLMSFLLFREWLPWLYCDRLLCLLTWGGLTAWLLLSGYAIGQNLRALPQGEKDILVWQVGNNPNLGFSSQIASLNPQNPKQIVSTQSQEETTCIGCHVYSESAQRLAYVDQDGFLTIDNITQTTYQTDYFAWNPDGTKLALALNNEDIYIYDLATEELTPLQGAAESGIIETMPAWHPNGDTIAFVRPENPTIPDGGLALNNPTDIYTISISTSAQNPPSPLTGASETGIFEYYPAYSPDGTWLAFNRHQGQTTYADPLAEIWTIATSDDNQLTRLVLNDQGVGNSHPVFADDWLLFGTKRYSNTYDIAATQIGASGQNSTVYLLQGASDPTLSEVKAIVRGMDQNISSAALLNTLANSLLWLVPVPLFLWLLKLICVYQYQSVDMAPIPPTPSAPTPTPTQKKDLPVTLKPLDLPPFDGLPPLWTPQPALIIGLGRSGRWTLTHLKKNLIDAGLGEMPAGIRLLAIDTGDYTATTQNPFRFADVKLADDEIIELRDSIQPILNNADQDYALQHWVDVLKLRGIGAAALNIAESGASGRRDIARLSLLHNLRGGSRDESIWNRLRKLAPDCRDTNNNLNVILIGSLEDDIGSGGFVDLAHVARTVVEQDYNTYRGIKLTAHLITNTALQSTLVDPQQARLNTGAALNELERFQLAFGLPSKMKYATTPDQPTLFDQVVNTLLLDELYLYDGMRNITPEFGVYPLVADALAFWLDEAANRDGLETNRGRVRQMVSTAQAKSNQAMVSGMGVFAYRLPFYDLLEDLTATFSRDVIHRLLMGNRSGTPRLSEAAPQERFLTQDNSAAALADAFLNGTFPLKNKPDMTQLLQGEIIELDPYLQYLNDALQLILNGQSVENSVETSVEVARGGKLSLAVTFLMILESRIKPNRLRERCIALSDQLMEHAEWLGNSNSGQPDFQPLYHRLAETSTQIAQRRDELDKIATRHYIWEQNGQPLRDRWYQTELLPHLRDALRQISWDVIADRVVLSLQTEQKAIILRPDTIDEFAENLQKLALRYIANLRNSRVFADVLTDVLSQELLASHALPQLLQRSQPALEAYTPDAPDSHLYTFLAVNTNLPAYQTLLDNLSQSQRDLQHINSTNPFMLALVQSLDVVPLQAVTSVKTGRHDALHNPLGIYVFESEAKTAEFVRRIDEIREIPRLFHPVVRILLSDYPAMQAFAMMLGMGQVALMGNRVSIDNAAYQNSFIPTNPNLPPLADAALQFMLQTDAQAVQTIIDNLTQTREPQQTWEDWVYERYLAWLQGYQAEKLTIMEDLLAVARLILRNEVQG